MPTKGYCSYGVYQCPVCDDLDIDPFKLSEEDAQAARDLHEEAGYYLDAPPTLNGGASLGNSQLIANSYDLRDAVENLFGNYVQCNPPSEEETPIQLDGTLDDSLGPLASHQLVAGEYRREVSARVDAEIEKPKRRIIVKEEWDEQEGKWYRWEEEEEKRRGRYGDY